MLPKALTTITGLLYAALCIFAILVTFPHMKRQLEHGLTFSWPNRSVYIDPEWSDRNNPLAGVSSVNPPDHSANAASNSSGTAYIHPGNPLQWVSILLFILLVGLCVLFLAGYSAIIYADRLRDQRRSDEQLKQEISRIGWRAYLKKSGAKKIAEDECGVLYRRKAMNGSEPLAVLSVLNSTPEPDGSYRRYYLRVPPRITGAREAAAWTFGMRTKEYKPSKET